MHCRDCFRVSGANQHTPTILDGLVLIANLTFQLCHFRHTGRSLVMHEHRDIELTGLEGAAYVLQMHADFFETVFVPGRLRGDLNGATVFTQHKMMRGLLLVKARSEEHTSELQS